MGFLMWIIMGGLAGYIAEQLMKANMGVFANIGLGILGAFVANWILGALGIIANDGFFAQGAVAVGGACLLIYIYRAWKGRTA